MKKDLNYQKFGEAFWKFYTENGFGTKSKSDIDSEIYDIICELGYIDDTKSALLIGRDLSATETSIKKYKEERFFKHKVKDEQLKEQVKDIFKNNQSKIVKGRIVFTVSNVAAKLYIEELLHNSGQNYDYTNNPSNISMDVETFICIYQKIGGDVSSLLNVIKNIDVIKEDKKIVTDINNIQKQLHLDPTININFSVFGSLLKTEPSVVYSILQFVCTSFKHKK